MIGGIEAGGTKCVLAVGPEPGRIDAMHIVPTRSPDETIADILAWFASQPAVAAVGLATFGPVGLDRSRPDWGHILQTPKPGWSGFDFAGALEDKLGVPVAVETDVNAAALAEANADGSVSSLAYMTVGTGIGVGLLIDGRCVHGAAHPEMGHYRPRRPAGDNGFAGICPFHGDCLEGLASGPAIIARWGSRLSDLPPYHSAHGLIADYLAQTCHTLFAATSVEVIVVGGGVLATPALHDRIVARCMELDAGYFPGGNRHRIIAPRLDAGSGITGAMLLASGC
ncbi:ROK family protein [Sphingomonas kaistensis]|uniref:fructokinase n=1 Tax=Sphingomonas kaistensis TaxID=298708 RepID=A0ABZ2G3K6_9SPHN